MTEEPISKEEVIKLRRTIANLQCKVDEYERICCGVYIDDMIEYLIIARTSAMNDKFQDAIKCTVDSYRKVTEKNETMKEILEFFEGKTIKEKKNGLRDFLKEHPCFRTEDPKLLLQRLRLQRKYGDYFALREIPLTPIKDAIEEFNGQEGEENLLK